MDHQTEARRLDTMAKLVSLAAEHFQVQTETAALTVADLKTDLAAVDGLAKGLVTTLEDKLDLTALLAQALCTVTAQTLVVFQEELAAGAQVAVAEDTPVAALYCRLEPTVQGLVAEDRSLGTARHRYLQQRALTVVTALSRFKETKGDSTCQLT